MPPSLDRATSMATVTKLSPKRRRRLLPSKNVNRLASSGKIDKSWATVKVSKVEKKTFGNTPEWVVVFNNSDIADTEKRTLYVFLSVDGEYLAANHTGK